MKSFFANLPKGHPAKKIRYKKVNRWGMYSDDGNLNWPGGGGPMYDVIHPAADVPTPQMGECRRPVENPEGGSYVDEILTAYMEAKELFVYFGTNIQKIQKAMKSFFANLPKGHPAKKIRYKKVNRWDLRMYSDDGNLNWPGGGGPMYDVIHPVTGKPCKPPALGWCFQEDKMKALLKPKPGERERIARNSKHRIREHLAPSLPSPRKTASDTHPGPDLSEIHSPTTSNASPCSLSHLTTSRRTPDEASFNAQDKGRLKSSRLSWARAASRIPKTTRFSQNSST